MKNIEMKQGQTQRQDNAGTTKRSQSRKAQHRSSSSEHRDPQKETLLSEKEKKFK